MRNFTKKVLIVLFILLGCFVIVGCKKDDPTKEPNTEYNEEQLSVELEVNGEKKIELNGDYEYDVDIADKTIVGFSGNTFYGLKEGSTKVTITTNSDKTFKRVYTVTVTKEKELDTRRFDAVVNFDRYSRNDLLDIAVLTGSNRGSSWLYAPAF